MITKKFEAIVVLTILVASTGLVWATSFRALASAGDPADEDPYQVKTSEEEQSKATVAFQERLVEMLAEVIGRQNDRISELNTQVSSLTGENSMLKDTLDGLKAENRILKVRLGLPFEPAPVQTDCAWIDYYEACPAQPVPAAEPAPAVGYDYP